MLELVRRLTLATQQGIVKWDPASPERKDHFKTEIAGKVILVKVEEQFAEVLVQVLEKDGRPMVAIDSTLVSEQSERRLFVELMEVVRRKEAGIDDLLDILLAELLACLPEN
jgi:hypothetical protein